MFRYFHHNAVTPLSARAIRLRLRCYYADSEPPLN